MNKKNEAIELELVDRKTTKERWDAYADLRDQLDNDPIPESKAKSFKTDTLATARNTDLNNAKKAADVNASFWGSQIFSSIVNFFSPSKTSKDDTTVTGTTGTSIGTPVLETGADIVENELQKILKEMLEILAALKKMKEDTSDENNKKAPNDLVYMMLVRAMLNQRVIREEAAKTRDKDIVLGRERTKEYHDQQKDIDTVMMDSKTWANRWGNANYYISKVTKVTGAIVMTVGLASIITALGPGAAPAAIATASALQMPNLVAGVTQAILGVTNAVTSVAKTHFDSKTKDYQAQLMIARELRDAVTVVLRGHIDEMIRNYERTHSITKEMKEVIENVRQTGQTVAGR